MVNWFRQERKRRHSMGDKHASAATVSGQPSRPWVCRNSNWGELSKCCWLWLNESHNWKKWEEGGAAGLIERMEFEAHREAKISVLPRVGITNERKGTEMIDNRWRMRLVIQLFGVRSDLQHLVWRVGICSWLAQNDAWWGEQRHRK